MAKRINGDLVAHGELVGGDDGVTYDRPHRTYYNRYGEPHLMPSDPIQLMILMEQGWTLHKPAKVEKRPRFQVMRDGSHFEFEAATHDVSASELARMQTAPGQRDAQALTPTATYYTREGTALDNLPADPESMAKYLAAGLSLNPPPDAAKASSVGAKPTRLRAVREA